MDFVSVPTRDPERARRFYAEVLGLPPNPHNRYEFETANVTLTLWEPEAQGVPFSPNTAGIALRVADVNAAREELTARGVKFLGDVVDTGACLMGFFYTQTATCSFFTTGMRPWATKGSRALAVGHNFVRSRIARSLE